MVNRKHLKMLDQGVETWNRWHKDRSYIKPNKQIGFLPIELHFYFDREN